MPTLDAVTLVDHDLSPLLSRYRSIASLLRLEQVDPDDILIFVDDTNERLARLLDRLTEVPHEN
jgi:hypothetical protein